MAHELPMLCVLVSGPEKDVRNLIAKHALVLEATRRDGEEISGYAFVTEERLKALKAPRLKFKVVHDATAHGRERQKEVMTDNPYRDGGFPAGLGRLIKGGRDVS